MEIRRKAHITKTIHILIPGHNNQCIKNNKYNKNDRCPSVVLTIAIVGVLFALLRNILLLKSLALLSYNSFMLLKFTFLLNNNFIKLVSSFNVNNLDPITCFVNDSITWFNAGYTCVLST